MTKVIIKKNEECRIKNGHLWLFSNELQNSENEIINGEIVEVYDYKDNFIGSGFYNTNSLIAVRIVAVEKIIEIKSLFEERLASAYNLRKEIYPDRDSFRMVFSESDFLPGLIIDKYNNTFVLQVYSAGMEKNIDIIVSILKERFNAQNIFSKNESYFRKLEGLNEGDVIHLGAMKDEIISDGNVKYKIDFEKSHKTGFYFDQCDNREFLSKYSKNKSVLDCFCNSGGFGLHAAKGEAASITFVDSSSHEIENAKYNFELNEFRSSAEFIKEDVFDYLEKCIRENKKFDIVNIDPPAFAKNKKSLPAAIKGYEKLNRLAMELVKSGGFLFTSSCSHHLKEQDFFELINKASNKCGKKIQLIYFSNASKDHPSLPAMPETVYLKFAVFRII